MKKNAFVLRGNLIYSEDKDTLASVPNGYLVCEENRCAGAFEQLPEQYAGLPLIDYGDQLIVPGLVDLHLHAPQFTFAGMGMDMELLPWLEAYPFREEAKYKDLAYAEKRYTRFAKAIASSATTRAAVFSSLHVPATALLMEKMEETGIKAFVGKVNMDRNSPDSLRETTQESGAETERWILEYAEKYKNIKPILTPRFIPSCTDELMEQLADLQKKYHLPVQSHLSENCSEIQWVSELHPESSCYGDAYDRYGLFGGDCPTIMAHCVHSSEEEINLMQKRGVYIAHCAQSNMNISSGAAPVRVYLERGMHVGLGTDVAGGFSLSVFRAMSDAVQASKLRWVLKDKSLKPLTTPEVFFMGTKGGGEFFGKVGSFEPGYEFDAVVLNDDNLGGAEDLSVEQRLERLIYLSDDRNIADKYIGGEKTVPYPEK
jgi:guanine deaminase